MIRRVKRTAAVQECFAGDESQVEVQTTQFPVSSFQFHQSTTEPLDPLNRFLAFHDRNFCGKLLILFLFLAGLFQGVSLAGEPLSAILEGIKKTYGPLSGLSVPYTREVITRSMSMLGSQAKGDMAAGTIYFKHPHFLKLEQEKPKRETIIANKDTLWWVIPDKKRAYRYPADDFGKELRLLSDIFRGLTHVEDTFQVVLSGEEPSGKTDILLTPDPPWQEIDRITVTADPDYTIHAIHIHNTLGTVTRFTLGPLSKTKEFEKGFFELTAPEEMEVIVEGADQ